MRLQTVQTNFSAGEISPRLLARTDLDKYQNAVSRLDNLIVQQHGGIVRRPGTKYVAHTKDSAEARLVPFEYSTTETYVVEFTPGFCRFYRDAGQVQWSDSAASAPSVTAAIYNAVDETLVFTFASAPNFNKDDVVTVSGATPTEYNISNAIVTAAAGSTITVKTTVAAGTWVSGGSVDGPYTIASPYLTIDHVNQFKYTQSADVLFIASRDYQPKELRRIDTDRFEFADYSFKDGPYLDINEDTTKTIETGALVVGSPVTVVSLGNILPLGTSAEDGKVIRWMGYRATNDATNTEWGWGYLHTVTGRSAFKIDVQREVERGSTTDQWRLGAWGGEDGWPEAVTFHQQRLWFSNTVTKPQTIWGTVIGGINTFSPTELDSGDVADDSGLDWTIYDLQANSIFWMVSMSKGLVLFTSNGEWLVLSSSSSDSLTPTNVGVFKHSNWGIRRYIEPKSIGPSALFVQRSRRKLREFSYAFEQDQYQAMDVTLLAEHITSGLLKQIEYQQEPSGTIWAIDENGVLLSMTYEKAQDLYGWSENYLGGTTTKVESIASIFENTEDRLWMSVRRTTGYDGAGNPLSSRFVEYLTPQFDVDDDVADAFFVDAGLSYSGPSTANISGLDHLEGQTVAVLVDGATHPDVVVSSGTIVLQVAGTKIHAGLPYTSRVDSLPLYALRAPFESRGRFSSVHSALLNFHQTVGAKAGPDENNLDIIGFREGSDPMDTALTPFTGSHELYLNSKYSHRPVMVITQEQPLPFTLLGVTYRVDVNSP